MSTTKTSTNRVRKTLKHAMAHGLGQAQGIAPEAKWRTLHPEQFDAIDLQTVDDVLSRAAIIGSKDWHTAVKGDAAAAICLALGCLPIDKITSQIDFAMTVLLRRALGGNLAAATTLSLILRNLPGRLRRHKDVSDSWFAYPATRLRRASVRQQAPE